MRLNHPQQMGKNSKSIEYVAIRYLQIFEKRAQKFGGIRTFQYFCFINDQLSDHLPMRSCDTNLFHCTFKIFLKLNKWLNA
jgi:hypothetical protein